MRTVRSVRPLVHQVLSVVDWSDRRMEPPHWSLANHPIKSVGRGGPGKRPNHERRTILERLTHSGSSMRSSIRVHEAAHHEVTSQTEDSRFQNVVGHLASDEGNYVDMKDFTTRRASPHGNSSSTRALRNHSRDFCQQLRARCPFLSCAQGTQKSMMNALRQPLFRSRRRSKGIVVFAVTP